MHNQHVLTNTAVIVYIGFILLAHRFTNILVGYSSRSAYNYVAMKGKKNLVEIQSIFYIYVENPQTSNKSQAAHKETTRDKRLQGQRKEFIDDTERKSICTREELQCIIVTVLDSN